MNPCSARLAAPFDDAVKASDDPFVWQREVDLYPQAITVKVVQHVQCRNTQPSPSRSAMKSTDQVMFGASGTAKASGLSRLSHLRYLIRRFISSS